VVVLLGKGKKKHKKKKERKIIAMGIGTKDG